ncbi:MAG: Txe/YoeB family addiction module toxin [Oscillospiraceae bacterium]|nr:Txe/YoeB family addiction module toxin [Oscillospiraceae bacterium]
MKINFTETGWKDYLYWQTQDKKTIKRINQLIQDIERNGDLIGLGDPEQLKYNLNGWYSRKIDGANRFVYRICDNTLEISQCRGHY